MEVQIKIYVRDYTSASTMDAARDNIKGLGKEAAGDRVLARTQGRQDY